MNEQISSHSVSIASARQTKVRKRYNKVVVIDLEKRALLRNLVKQNTRCEHRQIYTQANAICRRISSSYEEGMISAQYAMGLMLEAHYKMSHDRLPKEVISDEMNKRLNKLLQSEVTGFGVTMANVSRSNGIDDKKTQARRENNSANRYSESYWAEVI